MARSEPGWIIDRRADLLWFWGSALISLAAGALGLVWPALALPLFCAWLLFGDGPHFWATWTRSLWDPMERARRGPVLRRAGWIYLPGFVCWGLSRATGWSGFWHAFLGLAALWGYHHAVRQDYGLWSLYARRAGLSAREKRGESWFLYGSMWWIFAWFTVAHPLNAAELGLHVPGWLGPAMLDVWLVSMGLFACNIMLRLLRRQSTLPGLFILGPCAGLYGAGFLWIGMREPLVAGAANLEQSVAVLALANGLQHGLQYLGLVGFTAHNRYPEGGASLGARLSARPLRAWAVYVALSVPYVALNLARSAAPGVVPSNTTLVDLALCLYWGFVLHHYVLDQHIWRPHVDAQLRADLRLA